MHLEFLNATGETVHTADVAGHDILDYIHSLYDRIAAGELPRELLDEHGEFSVRPADPETFAAIVAEHGRTISDPAAIAEARTHNPLRAPEGDR